MLASQCACLAAAPRWKTKLRHVFSKGSASGRRGYWIPRKFWSWANQGKVHQHNIVMPDNEPAIADLSVIPGHIIKPGYALTGLPDLAPPLPVIWEEQQIEKIRETCKLARSALNLASSLVAPGVTTDSIDAEVRRFIIGKEAYPSPLNFKGFPKSISTSVNNVAAHGIPDGRALESGDIVNIDITVFKDGFHGDCSDTFPVGVIDDAALKLIQVTRQCLDIGISGCKSGVVYGALGRSIHKHARANQLATIQALLGHGIGTFFHGPPDIYHCLNNYPGKMAEGMVFTVEPCLTEGSRSIRCLRDGCTLVTLDNSRAAQAEHTILITQHVATS